VLNVPVVAGVRLGSAAEGSDVVRLFSILGAIEMEARERREEAQSATDNK